ncbi:hypothetical protein OPKNFCMD_6094 [Methylobacterium crusticola]|uniref:Uncharacterized protein n=1 Tax=Methylobacterium crusticola TaxID=1697972 RepID=A0ABQ4R865_9HYPH|nr:hypothetical protein [Methylobacterium crusticola]GJD53319.1 hypothetical protein OPKNFCMD_6094 [Methylobacterium crusticola]
MKVGDTPELTGDVTTLKSSGLFNAENIERMIGYGTGRLAKGYFVLVLKDRLTEDDFEFGGTTLRSGGREGLPAASAAADKARVRVHDRILRERGPAGYRMLQKGALVSVTPTGEDRIVKILPAIRHADDLPPNVQYPMGGGGLQWNVTKARKFLVAASVDATGHAVWPGGAADIGLGSPGTSARVDARAQLRRYIQGA